MWLEFLKVIEILDKTFESYITKEELSREVAALGNRLTADYQGKEVLFLGVLNGAFMFMADLLKEVNLPCEVSFVKMSSYQGTSSLGNVKELIGLNTDLSGKHVVVVEDIVDSGLTMDLVVSLIRDKQPESLKICTLLFKPDAFKGVNRPDYVGFVIPDAFVVGYGLDYNEKGRNLGEIYQIRN